MEIIRLNDSYRGRELVFRYRTEHYYEISTREGENTFFFSLERRPFPTPVEKQFTDKLLEPWLEEPRLFAAVDYGGEVGYVELSHERWNNRMRVSNLWVGVDREDQVSRFQGELADLALDTLEQLCFPPVERDCPGQCRLTVTI